MSIEQKILVCTVSCISFSISGLVTLALGKMGNHQQFILMGLVALAIALIAFVINLSILIPKKFRQDGERAELWREHVRKLIDSREIVETRELFLDFLVREYKINEWERKTLNGLFTASLLTHGTPTYAFPHYVCMIDSDGRKREPDYERIMQALSSGFRGILTRYEDDRYKDVRWNVDEDIFERFVDTLEIPERFVEEHLKFYGWEDEMFRPKLKQAQATI